MLCFYCHRIYKRLGAVSWVQQASGSVGMTYGCVQLMNVCRSRGVQLRLRGLGEQLLWSGNTRKVQISKGRLPRARRSVCLALYRRGHRGRLRLAHANIGSLQVTVLSTSYRLGLGQRRRAGTLCDVQCSQLENLDVQHGSSVLILRLR